GHVSESPRSLEAGSSFPAKNKIESASHTRRLDFHAQKNTPLRILDVCTGSGCIALALAHVLGDRAEITATDISPDALALAKKNAEKLGLSARVKFIESDLISDNIFQKSAPSAHWTPGTCVEVGTFPRSRKQFPGPQKRHMPSKPNMPSADEKFDIIISNPPYITAAEMQTLSPSVRDHEPHLALNGGPDGLDLYRRLIPQAKNALREGGALFFEIGPVEVADLLRDEGFSDVEISSDYAGLPRIVRGVSDCSAN
ncbi:MAG: peptide chain release factor N(5)-glutamine methyltransferase, partial [Defluviitaleaceae bacterium]|nr:peptide chain release factor N(5)-glutamine methyltransferase [Defluviitaleaceae bacterium]